MTITEVIKKLLEEKEKKVASRFPCRAVMVDTIKQYIDLLSALRKIPEIEFLPTGSICSGDVLPQYQVLTGEQYRNRWLVVTGASEYLRLFGKNEAEVQRFGKLWHHQFSADSYGRIIFPLWGCRQQWNDRALGLQSDQRQDDFVFDCCDEGLPRQEMNLLVFSGVFESSFGDMAGGDNRAVVFHGLRELFEYWEDPTPDQENFILMTKRFQSIQKVTGNISIERVDGILEHLKETLGESVDEKNCPPEAQRLLMKNADKGMTVDESILNSLNVKTFRGTELMKKWESMSSGEKQLMKLWYTRHPDDSYLCRCFGLADTARSVEKWILMEVFQHRNACPKWVSESQTLIKAMGLRKTEEYFSHLDQIPNYGERLQFLAGGSREERIYLLRMVGSWARCDATQVYECSDLKDIYPELYVYLAHPRTCADEELNHYIRRYKTYKLSNTLPEDEDLYFGALRPEEYEARYTLLHQGINDDCCVLWIDGMGVEWLSLLEWTLLERSSGKLVSCDVAQAILPTETEFNDQWKYMEVPHDKKDKLDKLAHKGVVDEPDYYSCVEEQFTFVSELAGQVNKLLEQYHRVIITSDHGSSRLAARFFHKRKGMDEPPNAEVCSHGRYCKLSDPAQAALIPNAVPVQHKEETFAIFQTYDHFKCSGRAAGASDDNITYGEIHGGASPEEMLIPVVIVDSKREVPPRGVWKPDRVKIVSRKAVAVIQFNKQVKTLEASTGSYGAETVCIDKKTWQLTFKNIPKGDYSVSVKANGILVPMPALTVLPALGEEDDLL